MLHHSNIRIKNNYLSNYFTMTDYWIAHSPVSQPGEDALPAIQALPSDIISLHHAANQLVLHYRALADHVLPERRQEIHTRYADAMFTRIFTRGPGATLSEDRGRQDKTVGCCRDSALLFVSLARSKGYGARIRIGFAAYFNPGYMLDHTVAEIWDPAETRWRLVDADVPATISVEVGGKKVDPLDLRPGIDFVTAPELWALARAGKITDVDRYTGYPEASAGIRGWPFIAHNVLHDLAALEKKELLLWDEWGWLEYAEQVPEERLPMLDEVTEVTKHREVAIEDVKKLMARDDIAIPDTAMLYDPYGEAPPKPVDISRALKV